MIIEEQIKKIIQQSLAPEHFELVNESHLHKGHSGDDGSGQTHFKLMVVSRAFDTYNRVQRQRAVLDLLKPLFSEGLHAISISAKTPQEYERK